MSGKKMPQKPINIIQQERVQPAASFNPTMLPDTREKILNSFKKPQTDAFATALKNKRAIEQAAMHEGYLNNASDEEAVQDEETTPWDSMQNLLPNQFRSRDTRNFDETLADDEIWGTMDPEVRAQHLSDFEGLDPDSEEKYFEQLPVVYDLTPDEVNVVKDAYRKYLIKDGRRRE